MKIVSLLSLYFWNCVKIITTFVENVKQRNSMGAKSPSVFRGKPRNNSISYVSDKFKITTKKNENYGVMQQKIKKNRK